MIFERNSEKVGKVGSEKAGNENVGTRAWEVRKRSTYVGRKFDR